MSRSMVSSTIVFMLFGWGDALACSAGSNNATDACTSKGLAQTPPDETSLLQLRVQSAPAPSQSGVQRAHPGVDGVWWYLVPTPTKMIRLTTKTGARFQDVPEYIMSPAPPDSNGDGPGALPPGSPVFPIGVVVSELEEAWGKYGLGKTVVIDRGTPKEEIIDLKGYEKNKYCGMADLILAHNTKYSHAADTKVELLQKPWALVTYVSTWGMEGLPGGFMKVTHSEGWNEFHDKFLAAELKTGWRGCKVKRNSETEIYFDGYRGPSRFKGTDFVFQGGVPFVHGYRQMGEIADRNAKPKDISDLAYYYDVDNPEDPSVKPIVQTMDAWKVRHFNLRSNVMEAEDPDEVSEDSKK